MTTMMMKIIIIDRYRHNINQVTQNDLNISNTINVIIILPLQCFSFCLFLKLNVLILVRVIKEMAAMEQMKGNQAEQIRWAVVKPKHHIVVHLV